MARHSKWHKVRQFKGALDAKRAASFTKLAREITVAARDQGADPAMNAGLRAAIDRARAASMPKDNIDRAISRGVGGGTDDHIEALTYEAYAPGGTALVIECLIDNRNRTANDIKYLLTKSGGSLASAGSVTYLFDHLGVIRIPTLDSRFPIPDSHYLALIEAGATNILSDGELVEAHCGMPNLAKVAETVSLLGLTPNAVELQWIPKTLVDTNESTGTAVVELIEKLAEHDDVSRVWSNMG